jgi:DNA-binding NarL/FixJ family response regulator
MTSIMGSLHPVSGKYISQHHLYSEIKNHQGIRMLMPRMSGARVFDLLKEINPAVRVLLTSGYNYDEDTAESLSAEGMVLFKNLLCLRN